MWNWVKDMVKQKVIDPLKPYINPTQPQYVQNPRLTSYLDYRLNEAIISYIEVDNTRLYFEAFNKEETVQTLQEQYVKFHGKEMVLESEQVKISPSMPLTQIINSSHDRHIFQEIVEKLQRKEKVEVKEEVMPEETKEKFKKIIKKCNQFHSYECMVHITHGLRKPLSYKTTITGETTFGQMLKKIKEHPLIIGDDIEFLSEKGVLFDPATYEQPFHNLNIHEPVMHARYSYRNSLLRGDTLIAVNIFEGKERPVKMLGTAQKEQEYISFNSKEKRMDMNNKLTNFREQLVSSFYRITLTIKLKEIAEDEIPIILEASGSLRIFVLTGQFEEIWVPLEKLTTKHQIGGLHPRENSYAIYQIDRIEQIKLEKPETFFSLEVLPAHQFIANRLIIHNCDSFTIKAKYLGANPREEEVKFYRNQRISQKFGQKICKVGGLTLNNRQTFGDYQLDQFQIIYVHQGEKGPIKRQHIISEWKKESVDRDNAEQAKLQEFNRKLKEQYFGIYNQRIIPSRQIQKICKENEKSVVNVLVALRMHFERINYHMNKEPKYLQDEERAYEEHRKKWGLEQKKEYETALKNGKKDGLSAKEVMGIHLYTSSHIYKQLNAFLRDDYIKDEEEMQKKYLPLTGWLSRSAKKAQPYRGVTYRGIGNIDLKRALNLGKYKEDQYKDKFIIFTSFTSTSIQEGPACSFFSKEENSSNCLYKLIVSSGNSIERYSYYSTEKEVLILPFTYFVINNYNLDGPIQRVELQEIPMPQTNSQRLIFWVDDEPDSNAAIKEYFENKGIQVVQVTTTRVMKIILQNFFWIFKMLGRKVVILSDMVRKEYGIVKYTAGVDLFQHIFNDYGLSNKAIIFASDKARAEANLKDKGVVQGNWVVITDSQELIDAVQKEFDNM